MIQEDDAYVDDEGSHDDEDEDDDLDDLGEEESGEENDDNAISGRKQLVQTGNGWF